MKFSRLTFITLLILGVLNQSFAQNYRNRQLAVISYNVSIHQSLKVMLDQHANLFPDVENRRADKIIAALKERSWVLIEDRLEAGTGMYILPLNAHGKSFSYDVYGFPEIAINRALRVGTSKHYIRVDLTLSATSARRDTGYGSRPAARDTSTNEGEVEGDVTPQVSITVTTYTDKGVIPLQRVTGTATASRPWFINEDIFTGLANRKEWSKEDTNTIMGLINAALDDVLKNF